ncbi:MAG TPA: hypothetical protein VGJ02_05315 [Pyrinomonadaceae bacterium]
MKQQVIEAQLFADYFQFYLQDDDIRKGNLENVWTEDTVNRLLAVDRFAVHIGTVRNMFVPVTVNITGNEGIFLYDRYDLVNRCGLEIETGRIVIAGCVDNFQKARRIEMLPGFYVLTIGYGNLDSLSDDGLDGDDFYDIFITPADNMVDVSTLKDTRKQ